MISSNSDSALQPQSGKTYLQVMMIKVDQYLMRAYNQTIMLFYNSHNPNILTLTEWEETVV